MFFGSPFFRHFWVGIAHGQAPGAAAYRPRRLRILEFNYLFRCGRLLRKWQALGIRSDPTAEGSLAGESLALPDALEATQCPPFKGATVNGDAPQSIGSNCTDITSLNTCHTAIAYRVSTIYRIWLQRCIGYGGYQLLSGAKLRGQEEIALANLAQPCCHCGEHMRYHRP